MPVPVGFIASFFKEIFIIDIPDMTSVEKQKLCRIDIFVNDAQLGNCGQDEATCSCYNPAIQDCHNIFEEVLDG
jgi:hypothetical protein